MDLNFVVLVRNLDISVFKFLSYTLIITAVVVLVALQITVAPYGRYSSSTWGYQLNGKLAWFLQEIPAFAIPVILLFMTENSRINENPNRILLGCFLLHYFQRSLIFPFLINGGKPTPLTPFLMALVFCIVNGYLQGGFLIKHADFGSGWIYNPRFFVGIFLFFFGMIVNIHSDHILRNLRKPGETGYKIPKGGMFEYVSGANFFGEMIEWIGFAIANNTLAAYSFVFFTICNIGPRACQHHRYYKEKFDDYPLNRKAVIPFVI